MLSDSEFPKVECVVSDSYSSSNKCVHQEVWVDQKSNRDLIICKKCNEVIGIVHWTGSEELFRNGD